MAFTWPFTSVTSPGGGIIIMWSTSRIFFEVTLFQQLETFKYYIGCIEKTLALCQPDEM